MNSCRVWRIHRPALPSSARVILAAVSDQNRNSVAFCLGHSTATKGTNGAGPNGTYGCLPIARRARPAAFAGDALIHRQTGVSGFAVATWGRTSANPATGIASS
jgi:hypothetical protein